MVAAAALVMATGCSGEEPGTPSGVTSTSTTGSATSSSQAAARPAELTLDDVEQCELVDQAARQRFGIDRPDTPSATDPEAPVCTLLSSTAGGYVVALERAKGIDALGRDVNTSVTGFPAVEIRQENVKVGHLSIDVADGQRLDVEVQRLSSGQQVDEIYRDTMLFAESVLATLRRTLGR